MMLHPPRPVLIPSTTPYRSVQLGVAWTFDTPPAPTDNSGTATLSILSTTTNTTRFCGNTFAATRVWQALDGCSNSATCSQTVTVIDTTPPVLNCSSSANKTVQLGVAWTFDTPPAPTDNSGTATLSILSTTTNTTGF